MRFMFATISVLSAAAIALACDSSDSEPSHPPQCPTTAVPVTESGAYPHSGLPSGACRSAEGSCQLGVLDCAPGFLGPINQYTCVCVSGMWSCSVTLAGGAYCSANLDGSPGASTDASGADSTDASSGDSGKSN